MRELVDAFRGLRRTPTFAAVAIGLALAVPAMGALRALLVYTSPYDGVAFTAAPGILLFAVVIACFVPALRATRIEPMVELRNE